MCGIGLDAYWSQFAGLKERLEGYVAQVAARLQRPGVEVVNLGLVDTPARSREAGHQCRREDIDVLFLYVTTYALSNTVLPLVQRAGVPVVVLNLAARGGDRLHGLQPARGPDGDDRRVAGILLGMPGSRDREPLCARRIPFHQVTGVLMTKPIRGRRSRSGWLPRVCGRRWHQRGWV